MKEFTTEITIASTMLKWGYKRAKEKVCHWWVLSRPHRIATWYESRSSIRPNGKESVS